MHADTHREHLTNLFAFVRLMLALEPGEWGYQDERTEQLIAEIKQFLSTSPDDAFARRRASVESLLRGICEAHHSRLPPLVGIEQIGKDFRELESQTDVVRFGIEYGWLARRFRSPSILLPFELPPHARVGIGIFSGGLALEEADLLGDAFFLLAQSRRAYQGLISFAEGQVDSRTVEDRRRDRLQATSLNLNVGTFARLGVLTSAAFVESFVNSIGHTEANRQPQAPEKAEYLRGRSKGNFIPLDAKLEVFPSLIRPDGRSPLKVRDLRQRQEPFATFLAATKGVRDSAMHFAPGKAAIIRSPDNWLTQVEQAVLGSVAVARAFWTACYDGLDFPKYLVDLDVEKLTTDAEKRMPAPALTGVK